MYAFKNEQEDDLFNQRSFKIKLMKPREIMDYLGIDKKFVPKEKQAKFSLSMPLTAESNSNS